jgi:hypothetical protein
VISLLKGDNLLGILSVSATPRRIIALLAVNLKWRARSKYLVSHFVPKDAGDGLKGGRNGEKRQHLRRWPAYAFGLVLLLSAVVALDQQIPQLLRAPVHTISGVVI